MTGAEIVLFARTFNSSVEFIETRAQQQHTFRFTTPCIKIEFQLNPQCLVKLFTDHVTRCTYDLLFTFTIAQSSYDKIQDSIYKIRDVSPPIRKIGGEKFSLARF